MKRENGCQGGKRQPNDRRQIEKIKETKRREKDKRATEVKR